MTETDSLNVLILYYSGTGNTKFACEVARAVLERAGHEVTMETYKKSGTLLDREFDLYCFAVPVYEWAPARNVERFVNSMPRLAGRRAFILTSSAGAKGQATNLFAKSLQDKGLTVLGDYNLICPDSWGGMRRWSHTHDSETPTVESVRELAAFTGRMLELNAACRDGRSVGLPDYSVRTTGLLLAARLSRRAPSSRFKMGKKKVDESACTKCEVCVTNCPVGAIALGPYPEFGKECIACWRCINTCPVDCITTLIDSRQHYKGIARKKELLKEAGLE
jgi:ferredoxin/flavodoxin